MWGPGKDELTLSSLRRSLKLGLGWFWKGLVRREREMMGVGGFGEEQLPRDDLEEVMAQFSRAG